MHARARGLDERIKKKREAEKEAEEMWLWREGEGARKEK